MIRDLPPRDTSIRMERKRSDVSDEKKSSAEWSRYLRVILKADATVDHATIAVRAWMYAFFCVSI